MSGLTVLHLNTETGWRGGEAQTLLLARGLRERGHVSIIATPPGSPLGERARAAGLDVRAVRMRGEFDLRAVFALARLMRACRPDVLHYHTSHAITLGALAGLAAGFASRRPPAVLSRRVSFSLRRNPLARLKYRFRIDHIIAVSDGVRWVLIAEGLAPEKITVIHSGIDLSAFAPSRVAGERFRREAGVPEGAPLIGSVGALVPHKGHCHLLEAMVGPAARQPGLRLALVGVGPLLGELRRQSADLGLEGRVVFAGFRADMPAVIPAFDLLVLPSVSGEGSPAVVKEAMACGVPVVATELDGVREIVEDGSEALLVPPGDAARLSEAIERVLSDEPLRRRMIEGARTKVRDYSADRMVERTIEAYERLLRGSR
jgi:glycosyltransferase involved in cell wall biosynthesis